MPAIPFLIAFLSVGVLASDGSRPAPPAPDYPLIEPLNERSDSAARAAWSPMAGTAPVWLVQIDRRPVLRLRCNFRGTTIERASWDHALPGGGLDLSDARGITFRLFCGDPQPVGNFSLYLQSGDGWYVQDFYPDTPGAWNTITIEKSRTHQEGSPAGWDRISLLRFSAWRSRDVDTSIYLADFGLLDPHPPIVVVVGERVTTRRREEPAERRLTQKLDALGLGYAVIRDAELPAAKLEGKQLVILTRNPGLSRPACERLAEFVRGGGSVLVIGALPQVGLLQPGERVSLLDEPPRNDAELLGPIGRLVPELGQQAVRRSAERIGRIGPYANLDEFRRGLGGGEETAKLLDRVAALRRSAGELAEQGKFGEAAGALEEARRAVRETYASAQKSLPGEHRAFWCHSAFGVAGMSWDQAIKNLADNGFTAILPNMLWGGSAFYRSTVLPVAPEVAERGDQIEACLASCRKYGLQCHVWKVNWNMGGRSPQEFAERMRRDGRTQVRFNGEPEPNWLCPSNPANQQLEIDAMLEVATRYDVDGIHFDYIRYPDADACFCPGCRERFEKQIGHAVANWPADVRADADLQRQWLDSRRGNITTVVAGVHERVRKERPKCRISAAVFRNWPRDRDLVGQDWRLWCEKGYLDFVCPMDYTPSNRLFDSEVRSQLDWAGKVPCYPGVGLSVWPDRTDIAKLIEQIAITRRYHTGGFTIFNYAELEAQEIVPLCGKGITRK